MIFLIDVDFTCANPEERFKYAGDMPDRADRGAFQQWIDKCHDPSILHWDEPNEPVRQILLGLEKQKNVKLYYLTGRSEKQREETEKWLRKHDFPKADVLMRQNKDWRSPQRFKSEKIKELFDVYPNRQFATIDDDYSGSCASMYLNRNIFFLKVVNK